jgi:hypothetical protein
MNLFERRPVHGSVRSDTDRVWEKQAIFLNSLAQRESGCSHSLFTDDLKQGKACTTKQGRRFFPKRRRLALLPRTKG